MGMGAPVSESNQGGQVPAYITLPAEPYLVHSIRDAQQIRDRVNLHEGVVGLEQCHR